MITSLYKQFSRQQKVAWCFFRSSTSFTRFLSLSSRSEKSLKRSFGLEHEDDTYDDVFKRWFELEEIEMAPENEIQKNWTEPIFDTEVADLILQLESTDVKRFKAFQDRFGSQWLNVIPCINSRLKLSNQQFRIAIGLRLCSKICERHKCVCGKHGGWHSSLFSTHTPSVIEPRHLYRTDQKRPDGLRRSFHGLLVGSSCGIWR